MNNSTMDKKDIDRFWAHIHWLSVLAQQGSFTAAARRLSVSKAAVSQRMAELERAAGVTLIRRTTRSVHLTAAGRQLAERTRSAYDAITQSFAEICDLTAEPTGLLRITAPVALARQQLIKQFPEFLRRYPRIRLEIDMNDQVVSIATEGFDLAIRHVETPPDSAVAHRLCHSRTLLVASPEYLAHHGTPANPTQLREHRHLLYPRHQGKVSWLFERAGARHATKEITVPVHPYFVANNSEVLRDMACAGMGIALLPDFSAQSAVQSGTLVELLPAWRPLGAFGHNIFTLRPYSAGPPTRAVRAFTDYLSDKFAHGFPTYAEASKSNPHRAPRS